MAEVEFVSVEVPLSSLHGEIGISREVVYGVYRTEWTYNLNRIGWQRKDIGQQISLVPDLHLYFPPTVIIDLAKSDITPEKLGMAYDARLEEVDKAIKFLNKKLEEKKQDLADTEKEMKIYRRFIDSICEVPLERFIAIWEQASEEGRYNND